MKLIQQIEKLLEIIFTPLRKIVEPVRDFLFPEKYLEQVKAYKDALNMSAKEYYFRDFKYKVDPKSKKYISLYSLFASYVFQSTVNTFTVIKLGNHQFLIMFVEWLILVLIEDTIAAIFLRLFISSCEEV